ncbi:restriction endonuclease [Allonocardiopsis opalescens]|uniref:Restriction endonuclease n=1 Tax=Allonocardiopsis opalescens TaxID=1144618 RepID=A0A2T0QFN5_9ACTN|nr:restriction endonuclease [Allonocardiopsis opalescens]PRY02739.1 restriction endonuclease [Allonocardiopsis opalescens]
MPEDLRSALPRAALLMAAAVLALVWLNRLTIMENWAMLTTSSIAALLPLLVIASFVLSNRAKRREIRQRTGERLARFGSLPGPQFAELIALLLERDGYRRVYVECTRDAEIRIVARSPGGARVFVHCQYRSGPVSREAIADFARTLRRGGAVGVFATEDEFTGEARLAAVGVPVMLVDGLALERWAQDTPLHQTV